MAAAANSRMGMTIECYRANIPTSSGIFLGDMPLQTSLPLLLTQITIIFFTTRITHALLRPLGLPQIVSHVIAGIILGPTFLSRNQAFRNFIFPDRGWVILNMLGLVSFTLFIFVTGVKTELKLIYSHGVRSVALAFIACFPPFIAVLVVFSILKGQKPTGIMLWAFSMRWALTSNTVVAALLVEFNLLTTKLGRLAMSVSLIIDLTSMSAQTILLSVSQTPEKELVTAGLKVAAASVVFLAAIAFVARPLALWMIRQTPQGEAMGEVYMLLIVMMALGLALAGELIGQQYTMGPMLLGLMMPVGPPLGTTLAERMERLVLEVFLPLYTAYVGLKMDIRALVSGGMRTVYVSMLIMASVTTKLVGVYLFCIYCRMPFRDAIVLSLMMSSKGIMDVAGYSNWRSYRAVTEDEFSLNVLAMVIVGGVTATLMKHLYKPSVRYLAYRRRTIQHSSSNEELRLLVCIHNSDNVVPILNLLEVSYLSPDAPICVYLLHLSTLVGRTASVLFPYKQKQKKKKIIGRGRSRSRSFNAPSSASSTTTSESDQIVNAFRYLERHKAGGLTVLPFICIAPYATMHDDICNVALEKNVTLIVIPFHKHIEVGGSVHASIQEMNHRVLTYAPCSVAILVHGDLFTGPVNRVAVLFLGGADDREALAYAARIAENPTVSLTLVRFRPKEDARDCGGSDSREELLDNEAVEEFQAACMGDGRVEYSEEFVEDSAGTVGVIRNMSGDFSLLIVGRRDGVQSIMTEGMDAWSEYPELGLVGDVLASSDFGKTVSTMVVQQQLQKNRVRE